MSAPSPCPNLIPPNWGGPLSVSDYAALDDSWITHEIADAAMLRRVDSRQGAEVVGHKGSRDCAGILFPYYWPGDPSPFDYRVRRDNPELVQGKNGKLKQDRKYLGAPGASNRLYIPPGITLDQLNDPSIPIVIVEGEKKALALWRLANFEIDRPRFIPVAIAGVWNWRGKVGKASSAGGERVDVNGPISDLSRIVWKDRQVQIVFDRNVHSDGSVSAARKGIARELATRAAEVRYVNLPEDCGVNGVDDLLAAWGPTRVLELFDQSIPASALKVVLPPQFHSTPQGMFRTSGSHGALTQVQISTYQARIIANIVLDDGVETKREFEVEAELMGCRSRFTISADEFAGMEWVIKTLGASAVTYPNQREYARTAIQFNSLTAEHRRIYTHSGWRELGGGQRFLHAGGAIGADGAVSGISVRFGGTLAGYQLRLPVNSDALVAAVRASLRLLELSPPMICFPLLAATFRAVLSEADFGLHLAGETGTFKSALAALHQQHFGAGMDRLHLPGNWTSTGNALETMAFHAKDTLFVIDDFAPQGSVADVARYHAAGERVFRAAGNQAGRSRLDSAARLREPKPPRALILSTGEDIPKGHSVRARIFILEVAKGAIDTEALTQCQRDGREGLYAEAMGAFIQRIARQYEEMRAYFNAKLLEFRELAGGVPTHARTPEIVANLQAAFELFLDFAGECGAVSSAERANLSERCWDALRQAAAAQTKHQTATEPTATYFTVLRATLTSGHAHLASRQGGPPEGYELSCGWRRFGSAWSPSGDCIGWLDGEDIYLEPAAAYRLVQVRLRDAGETLSVSEPTLRRRLHERGLLASTDPKRETLTVRRTICRTTKNVLHLVREMLLPEPGDDSGDAPWAGGFVG